MALQAKQKHILMLLSLVCILCVVAIVMAVYGTIFEMTRSKVMASVAVLVVVSAIGVLVNLLLRKMRQNTGT